MKHSHVLSTSQAHTCIELHSWNAYDVLLQVLLVINLVRFLVPAIFHLLLI